jgi:hypothetical protein
MSASAILIAQLILQYGIPAAIQIINIINKPTVEEMDLAALKDIKPPSAYLTIASPV